MWSKFTITWIEIHLALYFQVKRKYAQSPKLSFFQTENPRSLKYGLDAIPYRASQLWKQVPTDIGEAASLAYFKNHIKTWKCESLKSQHPWLKTTYQFYQLYCYNQFYRYNISGRGKILRYNGLREMGLISPQWDSKSETCQGISD